jgi:hypothetical protein
MLKPVNYNLLRAEAAYVLDKQASHYNGPKNLNTARGGNKIYSTHDEKAIYSGL